LINKYPTASDKSAGVLVRHTLCSTYAIPSCGWHV